MWILHSVSLILLPVPALPSAEIFKRFHIISLLEPYQDIKQFQLIQEDFTHFRWILNTENHSYERMIIEYSKKLFGDDSEWKFEYVTELPKLKSGKRKMTVCNIVK